MIFGDLSEKFKTAGQVPAGQMLCNVCARKERAQTDLPTSNI